MAKYPNSGTLNINERRSSDRHPDYKGQASIGDTDYWLDAWLKDGPNGQFISISFKPKEARPGDPVPQVVSKVQAAFPGAKVVRDERKPLRETLDDEAPF